MIFFYSRHAKKVILSQLLMLFDTFPPEMYFQIAFGLFVNCDALAHKVNRRFFFVLLRFLFTLATHNS